MPEQRLPLCCQSCCCTVLRSCCCPHFTALRLHIGPPTWLRGEGDVAVGQLKWLPSYPACAAVLHFNGCCKA